MSKLFVLFILIVVRYVVQSATLPISVQSDQIVPLVTFAYITDLIVLFSTTSIPGVGVQNLIVGTYDVGQLISYPITNASWAFFFSPTAAITIPIVEPHFGHTATIVITIPSNLINEGAKQTTCGCVTGFSVYSEANTFNPPNNTVFGNIGDFPGPSVGLENLNLYGTNFNQDPLSICATDMIDFAFFSVVNIITGSLQTQIGTSVPLSSVFEMNNLTFVAGSYVCSRLVNVTGSIVLNGQNNPNSKFLFVFLNDMTSTVNANIMLTNGTKPCNVFWTVMSFSTATIRGKWVGNILSDNTANLRLSDMTLIGRVFSFESSVVFYGNVTLLIPNITDCSTDFCDGIIDACVPFNVTSSCNRKCGLVFDGCGAFNCAPYATLCVLPAICGGDGNPYHCAIPSSSSAPFSSSNSISSSISSPSSSLFFSSSSSVVASSSALSRSSSSSTAPFQPHSSSVGSSSTVPIVVSSSASLGPNGGNTSLSSSDAIGFSLGGCTYLLVFIFSPLVYHARIEIRGRHIGQSIFIIKQLNVNVNIVKNYFNYCVGHAVIQRYNITISYTENM